MSHPKSITQGWKRKITNDINCYALLTSYTDPEFLIPAMVKIYGKTFNGEEVLYKVEILEIYENNFKLLKEHLLNFKVCMSATRDTRNSLLKKDVIEGLNDMSDLIIALKKKFIYLNENYICTSISELHDLYDRFVKYIINYHYEQIYKLTNRTFLANSPIYENDKENYKKKINNIGFKNEFDRYGLKIDIHD